jgi:tRNA pseudouridine55 synthase
MLEEKVARSQKQVPAGQTPKARQLKKANQVKLGHGGTLDPLATGILIVGIGSATKQLNQFLTCTKTYEATVVFGASTDSYDRVGRILTKRPYDHITREKVEAALPSFRGKQIQMPPLYSALKMDGKPLYEYAREGKPIPREIKGREVEALEVELVEWYEPGKHNHRWPAEEAEAAERNLAEQVWRISKQQESSKNLTPEEKEEEDQAIAAHESFKQEFEKRQDKLIRDSPSGRRPRHTKEPPMMSGALGQLPQPEYTKRGANHVPQAPAENTPPPWNDEGPPAAKIRLTVTSGYYIRSFCHDLGAKLGSAALMAELARTRQSNFEIGGVTTLEYDDILKGEDVWTPQLVEALSRWNNREEKGPETNGKRSSPNKSGDESGASPRRNRPEKRQRSGSPERGQSPPRKTRAKGAEDAEKPRRLSVAERSEDEKSWNGIED